MYGDQIDTEAAQEVITKMDSSRELSGDGTGIITDTGSEVPDDDARAEEIAAFYKKMGVPDTPDGYRIKLPVLPDGMEYDGSFEGKARAVAHQMNVTKDQMEALFDVYSKHIIDQRNQTEVQLESDKEAKIAQMRAEMGGEYDSFVRDAKRLFMDYADEEFFETIKKSKLGNSPGFIKFCGRLAMTLEDQTIIRQNDSEENWEPKFKNSPDQYKDDNSENGKRARAWFADKAKNKKAAESKQKEADVILEGGYKPGSPSSPSMYDNADGPEGAKARAYFRKLGHKYQRSD